MSRRRWRWMVLPILLMVVDAVAFGDAVAKTEVPSAQSLDQRTITVGNIVRSYAVYRPVRADQALPPALIVLHGAGGTGAGMHDYFGARPTADRAGFVLVYPDGLNRQWNDGRPPSLRYLPQLQDVDDIGFLSAVIRDLVARGVADPGRIFVSGLSNGAGMALRLACERPELAAGFAFIATPASRGVLDACRPGNGKPMLFMHGTKDRVIPYEGGRIQKVARDHLVSARDLAMFWARRNGCDGGTIVTDVADVDPGDATRVRRSTYTGCRSGAPVMLLTIEGGGHQPPIAASLSGSGGAATPMMLGSRSHDIDAAETIWQFFGPGDRYAPGRFSERH